MNPERAKLLIAFLSVAGILAVLLGGVVGCAVAGACTAVMMVIYLKNIAAISNISEDNPKVRTLRGVTVFSAVYMIAAVLFAVAVNKGMFDRLTEKMSPKEFDTAVKLLMAAFLALPMAVYGNTAPKLPFNRFAGLRLPWTVRDEQTWLIAHRILGYLSLPLAILLFVPVRAGMNYEDYAKFWWTGDLLLWIGIPGVVSAVFYWRKFSGR